MSAPRLAVWPPLPPTAWFRRPRTSLPFPLGQPGCVLFSLGRHALWHGVRALGLEQGEEVLVPAYNHGSEVEALGRAGLSPRFYSGTDTLEPDEAELNSLVGGRTHALLLIHYLGFPQDVARWRAWCDRHGLLLLEDAAQSWLAGRDGRAGASGDVAITCLYKTFGLPDGAALVVGRGAATPVRREPGIAAALRRNAAWLASRGGIAGAMTGSRGNARAEFDLGDPDLAPSAASTFLLPRIADASAAERRRANYRYLLDELAALVAAPFARLPDAASPFAFPIEVEDKAETLRRLGDAGVRGLDFWSIRHPSIPKGLSDERRRARVVGLPVHQELRADDVERIAAAARHAVASVGTSRFPRTPSTGPLRGQAASRPAFDDVRPRLAELAEAQRNVFATPEFLELWWERLGRGRLRLQATDDVLVPLYEAWKGPLRVLRFLGHGAGDQLGPACSPSEVTAAVAALRAALGQIPHDLFLGEHLPRSARYGDGLGAHVLRREGSPVLRFGAGGWDQFLAEQSSNFRQQAGRKTRKLEREHDLRFRLTTRDTLQTDLDTLFRLHARRWGGADTNFARRETFHRAFVARALDRGWLRLWTLELDRTPAASWLGFRFAGVESYFQAGRDPAFDRLSVGFVLLCHSMRTAAEDGMSEYRFLRGGEEYKLRFTGEDEGVETIARSRGPAGAGVLAAANALDRTARGRALRRRLLA